ncbi:UvrD-helicase domain-containing protein [Hydrocarboniphaga effusa]|uniref:DNA 3'-5' helicase n=2 Tax=Gammaproteobacteria TaxID=1236 RepID=I7ZIR8_9GAMM|nr:UvrD-helicase domain-containing protein [Hydrocarboniphaga effusa]EIT71819.1 hypothetical protein WQQ_19560 [Hydrocarboniphaga effusa AP103]
MNDFSAVAHLVDSLNDAQKQAVTAPPEHRLVLAGAGSGKTRVLVHRIAWLIAVEDVSPLSILAVTFTNKAANEMRGRIEQLLTTPVRQLWVGTFHGIAHRMLRLHWKEAKLRQDFQILDADDQQRMVKRLIKQLDLPDDQWPHKMVTHWINSQKEEGRRPHHFDDLGDFTQRALVRVYTTYQQQCEAQGVVDFAELLLRAYELCRDNADILAHYRRKFRHVLVDEFQDTNTLQYLWLKLLVGDHGVLFAVGDDDQCLAAGTAVTLADGSHKPIEQVNAGDSVRAAFGSGRFHSATVTERVHIGSRRDLFEIVTRSGRRLVSTPEHTHFAGYLLGETPQTFFTYLMHKRGVGYRLGVSQVYTNGQVKPLVGFEQRCLHEHADAAWVVTTHDSANAARRDEILLSLRYGLPTLPFVARKGGSQNGLVHDPAWIAEVFESLDTESAAKRLLSAYGLRADQPHHRPRSRNANRRNVVITLCGDRRGARPMHRIGIVGNDVFGRQALELAGFSVRAAKAGSSSWRFEAARAHFGELLQIAERARKTLDGDLQLNARIGRRSLPFIHASAVRKGMVMLDENGGFDIVESSRPITEPTEVYDLNIADVHNFVAGGLVTHNSVYGWRGAKIENMLRLERDLRGCEIVRLEQNYRSTGTILKAANGLIERNNGRLGKNLWTEGSDGAPISLYAAFNEYDEAEFVVNRIKDYINGPHRYSDLAILYRSNAQSRVLEEMLIRARLPYRIYGGLRFFERMEVKDALAWLRLMRNRDDDISFERALATPSHGVGATSVEKLRAASREAGSSLWATAMREPALVGRSAGALARFLNKVESIATQTADIALGKLIDVVVANSGLREHYQKEKGEQAEGRLENLDEIVSAARSFEKPTPEQEEEGIDPLSAFLAHAALEAGEGQAAAGEDSVQLMTLHAAKGLEFPIVFMVGMENGLFPSMRAVEEGNLEEERRLCYVGITRARQQLYLSYAEIRRLHGVEQVAMPSQFLKEIPPECVMETRPRAGVLRPPSFGSGRESSRYGGGGYGGGSSYGGSGGGYSTPIRRSTPIGTPNYGGFKLGQRVMHDKFGEGTILSFEGEGEKAQVEIRFRHSGVKRLVLGLAKLQAV